MSRVLASALIAGLVALTAAPSQAQDTARQRVTMMLREKGLNDYQMSQLQWREDSRPIDDRFSGLEVSLAIVGGEGVSMGAFMLRNKTSKPYCVVPILQYSGAAELTFLLKDSGIMEPGQTAALAVTRGRMDGSMMELRWSFAYWPARTDVSTGRCWSIAPPGVKEWQAAGQLVRFQGSYQ